MLERGDKMNVPMKLANGNSIELNNITESGTGYIRFSDGTQICYESKEYTYKKTIDAGYNKFGPFTFKKSFTNHPIISMNRQNAMDFPLYFTSVSANNAEYSFTLYTERDCGTFNTISYSYIAIGRWK